MKEFKLPSGAKLSVAIAPFEDGESLYELVAKELQALKIEGKTEIDYNFFKDVLLSLISSKALKEKIKVCAARCTVNGHKWNMEYFDKVENRQDYIPALVHICQENIMPFMNGLFALLNDLGLGDLLGSFQR